MTKTKAITKTASSSNTKGPSFETDSCWRSLKRAEVFINATTVSKTLQNLLRALHIVSHTTPYNILQLDPKYVQDFRILLKYNLADSQLYPDATSGASLLFLLFNFLFGLLGFRMQGGKLGQTSSAGPVSFGLQWYVANNEVSNMLQVMLI